MKYSSGYTWQACAGGCTLLEEVLLLIYTKAPAGQQCVWGGPPGLTKSAPLSGAVVLKLCASESTRGLRLLGPLWVSESVTLQ